MATLSNWPPRVTTIFANIFRSVSCGDGRPREPALSEAEGFKPSTARQTACDHSNSGFAIERARQPEVSRLLSIARLSATLLSASLARQRCRIFVRALAESAFHPPGEADRRFPKLIAQVIGGRQGLLPTLVPRRFQQIKLA